MTPPQRYILRFAQACLLFLLLLTGNRLSAQNELHIHVSGVPNPQGVVRAALYDSKESFLSFDRVLRNGSSGIQGDSTRIVLKGIPDGTYAVALFHDTNNNGKLDKNFLGIPKEAVAFSRASMRVFGPPRYEDCAFEIKDTIRIGISF